MTAAPNGDPTPPPSPLPALGYGASHAIHLIFRCPHEFKFAEMRSTTTQLAVSGRRGACELQIDKLTCCFSAPIGVAGFSSLSLFRLLARLRCLPLLLSRERRGSSNALIVATREQLCPAQRRGARALGRGGSGPRPTHLRWKACVLREMALRAGRSSTR